MQSSGRKPRPRDVGEGEVLTPVTMCPSIVMKMGDSKSHSADAAGTATHTAELDRLRSGSDKQVSQAPKALADVPELP